MYFHGDGQAIPRRIMTRKDFRAHPSIPPPITPLMFWEGLCLYRQGAIPNAVVESLRDGGLLNQSDLLACIRDSVCATFPPGGAGYTERVLRAAVLQIEQGEAFPFPINTNCAGGTTGRGAANIMLIFSLSQPSTLSDGEELSDELADVHAALLMGAGPGADWPAAMEGWCYRTFAYRDMRGASSSSTEAAASKVRVCWHSRAIVHTRTLLIGESFMQSVNL